MPTLSWFKAYQRMMECDDIRLKDCNNEGYSGGKGRQWYWDMPIEVEYTEIKQDSQDGQNSHMTILTMLSEGKPV